MLRWAAQELRSAGGAQTEPEARRAFLERYTTLLLGGCEASDAKRRRRELKATIAHVIHTRAKRAAAPSGRALAHTDVVVTLNMTSEQAGYYAALSAGRVKGTSGDSEGNGTDKGRRAEAGKMAVPLATRRIFVMWCAYIPLR